MKARDAYVPFLLSKPLNNNEIRELFFGYKMKNIIGDCVDNICGLIFFGMNVIKIMCISILFIGLDGRNGTYSSLAFISGVGNKNPSSGYKITAHRKSLKNDVFLK